MIALVDYGAGNLTSVRKALAFLGAEFASPVAPEDIASSSAVIVPGVGHFAATRTLDAAWRDAIRAAVDRGAALFGICLGMQWLFAGSEEAPGLPGLGLLDGICTRLPETVSDEVIRGGTPHSAYSALGTPHSARLKVPHVGWNSLALCRTSPLTAEVSQDAQVYFTHSYVAPVTPATVAVTTYGLPFAAALQTGRIAGVQFHPEKSGEVGLTILRNWLTWGR